MFSDYIDRGALVNPDRAWATDGRTALTYREATNLTHRVALALRREGLEPGSRAAVYSRNDATALASIAGLVRAGVTWIALNPYAKSAELAALLRKADCEYMIFSDSLAAEAAELIDEVPTIKGAVGFGGDRQDEFDSWLAPVGGIAARLPFDADSVTMILASGGTTGTPKAVPITCRQCLAMCLAFNAHMPEEMPPNYLMATPMTHAAGVSAWPVLAEGGTVLIHDGVDPDRIFETIEREKVSRLFLPPTAIYGLLSAADGHAVDFSSLRHFIYASAPMSVDKLEEAMDVFGPVMTQTFGQAEAPMICTCMTPREHAEAVTDPRRRERLQSCGRQSLVATVEVMNSDGDLVPTGEVGEIVVRGDLVMDGYYGDTDASEGSNRPGYWHGTSDLGYRDADGYVYIVDRQRDMIITGGFNVYPSEIERVVWSMPAVLDCAVIGIPDDKWGEAVTAFVELKDGEAVTEAEIVMACKAELGSVKAPKSVVFDKLPRTANGKVVKRVIRDAYWTERERKV